MQTISFYDIDFDLIGNKVYCKKKTKVGELYHGIPVTLDYALKDQILEELFQYPDKIKLAEKLELNKKYYMIEEEPWRILGVISLHKGYTYIDCAEHDDRVIIKSAFPTKICNIVGE